MCEEFKPLLEIIEKNEKNYDIDKIKEAFNFAAVGLIEIQIGKANRNGVCLITCSKKF